MSAPAPFTPEQLEGLRVTLSASRSGDTLVHRLLATIDHVRADRDALGKMLDEKEREAYAASETYRAIEDGMRSVVAELGRANQRIQKLVDERNAYSNEVDLLEYDKRAAERDAAAYKSGFAWAMAHPDLTYCPSAKSVGVYPDDQHLRVLWEQGVLAAQSAKRLGHDVEAMQVAGIEAPSLLEPAVVIHALIDRIEALGGCAADALSPVPPASPPASKENP